MSTEQQKPEVKKDQDKGANTGGHGCGCGKGGCH